MGASGHTSEREGALGKGDLKADLSTASAPSTFKTLGSSGFLLRSRLHRRRTSTWLQTSQGHSIPA